MLGRDPWDGVLSMGRKCCLWIDGASEWNFGVGLFGWRCGDNLLWGTSKTISYIGEAYHKSLSFYFLFELGTCKLSPSHIFRESFTMYIITILGQYDMIPTISVSFHYVINISALRQGWYWSVTCSLKAGCLLHQSLLTSE